VTVRSRIKGDLMEERQKEHQPETLGVREKVCEGGRGERHTRRLGRGCASAGFTPPTLRVPRDLGCDFFDWARA
jgi:hypothetical protein